MALKFELGKFHILPSVEKVKENALYVWLLFPSLSVTFFHNLLTSSVATFAPAAYFLIFTSD